MQRLVVCLDGTGNVSDDTTNIWRIHALTVEVDANGIRQQKYYDQGVGTRWYDRVTGGVFGAGLYDDVKQAYNWIAERYHEGDELFLFGFSRGAATALSLANLIDSCGIIGPEANNTFEDAYRLYKMRGLSRQTPASERFRKQSANHNAKVTLSFLGLFDTVASLYASRLSGESMHVLSLPDSARHIAHAIAIDENRRLFQSVKFSAAPTEGVLEERWFSGAHANVGGGYAFDPLSMPPLIWMMREASAFGLSFGRTPSIELVDVLHAMERNSFEEFLGGIPALFPFFFRKQRQIDRKVEGNANERIDATAIARYRKFHRYRRTSSALSQFFCSPDNPDEGDFDVRQKKDALCG